MSLTVPLAQIANQSLTLQEDDVRYNLRLNDLGTSMSIDIAIDDVQILTGHRVTAGTPLIPYFHLENEGGNFLFLTELNDIVHWTNFTISQTLLYVTVEEIKAARAN